MQSFLTLCFALRQCHLFPDKSINIIRRNLAQSLYVIHAMKCFVKQVSSMQKNVLKFAQMLQRYR